MRFLIMIRRTPTGYCADIPDVPGCIATARTVKGARERIAAALALHLELIQQAGEPLPVPRQSLEFVIDSNSEEELCTWVEVSLPAPALTSQG